MIQAWQFLAVFSSRYFRVINQHSLNIWQSACRTAQERIPKGKEYNYVAFGTPYVYKQQKWHKMCFDEIDKTISFKMSMYRNKCYANLDAS